MKTTDSNVFEVNKWELALKKCGESKSIIMVKISKYMNTRIIQCLKISSFVKFFIVLNDLWTWHSQADYNLFRRWLLVQDTFLMYVNTDTGKCFLGYYHAFIYSEKSMKKWNKLDIALYFMLICLLLVQAHCLACRHTQTQHHLYVAIECNNEQTKTTAHEIKTK